MEKLLPFPIILLFLSSFFLLQNVTAFKNQDGSEEWGYVQVRPSKSFVFMEKRIVEFHFYLLLMLYDMIYDIKIIVIVIAEAHMFWWHYKSPYRVEDSSKPWPIILWLQGGPVSTL